jgi:hypothetical protein
VYILLILIAILLCHLLVTVVLRVTEIFINIRSMVTIYYIIYLCSQRGLPID